MCWKDEKEEEVRSSDTGYLVSRDELSRIKVGVVLWTQLALRRRHIIELNIFTFTKYVRGIDTFTLIIMKYS